MMNNLERIKIPAMDLKREIEVDESVIKPVSETYTKTKKTMSESLKETKEFLSFIFSLVYGTSKSLKDGKFQATDVFNYTGAVKKIPSAISGLEKVPSELLTLDAETLEELKVFIVDEFNLENEVQEESIEKIIVLASDFAKAVLSFK